MASNALREWGSGLLILGSIVAVFAGGFAIAQGLLPAAGPKTYGFADTAGGAVWIAVALCVLGGLLRALDYATFSRPRRLP